MHPSLSIARFAWMENEEGRTLPARRLTKFAHQRFLKSYSGGGM